MPACQWVGQGECRRSHNMALAPDSTWHPDKSNMRSPGWFAATCTAGNPTLPWNAWVCLKVKETNQAFSKIRNLALYPWYASNCCGKNVTECSLKMKRGLGSQFKGMDHQWRGRRGGRSLRRWVTLYPQSRSGKKWTLMLSSLSLFCVVRLPNPWRGAAHIQSGPSNFG